MTIGIVACGPNAGRAVFMALRSVERVATGSIGGFASFAAIDTEGRVRQYGTQRGGSTTLFTNGESTGVEPSEAVAGAYWAAVMSSGPDRPEPLTQFVRADPAAGLVSGHRFANALGVSGQAFNDEVLEGMHRGRTAKEAVDVVLDDNPEGDVGIIAADLSGTVYARNSQRVGRRPDLGHARREERTAGAVVEVLHNAVWPGPSVAGLAAETALETMASSNHPDGWVLVEAGTDVEAGGSSWLEIDDQGRVRKVVTTDRGLLTGRTNGAAIYYGAEVRQGNEVLGVTILEPNVVLEDGRIVSMSGQSQLRIGYRKR